MGVLLYLIVELTDRGVRSRYVDYLRAIVYSTSRTYDIYYWIIYSKINNNLYNLKLKLCQ